MRPKTNEPSKASNKTRQPRKSYDDPFKRDAVKLLDQPGYTLANASAALSVSQTTLSNWKKTILPKESAERGGRTRSCCGDARKSRWSVILYKVRF